MRGTYYFFLRGVFVDMVKSPSSTLRTWQLLFGGGIGLDQRAVEGLTTCLCRIVTHGLDMCHITYVVFIVI